MGGEAESKTKPDGEHSWDLCQGAPGTPKVVSPFFVFVQQVNGTGKGLLASLFTPADRTVGAGAPQQITGPNFKREYCWVATKYKCRHCGLTTMGKSVAWEHWETFHQDMEEPYTTCRTYESLGRVENMFKIRGMDHQRAYNRHWENVHRDKGKKSEAYKLKRKATRPRESV